MRIEVNCVPHRDYGALGSVAVSEDAHAAMLTLTVQVEQFGFAADPVVAKVPRAVMLELCEALLPWLRHKAGQP